MDDRRPSIFLTLVVLCFQVQGYSSEKVESRSLQTEFVQAYYCVRSSTNQPLSDYRYYYTPRDTMQCCYQDRTKDGCCFDTHIVSGQHRFQCWCHPSVICSASSLCSAPPQTLYCPDYAQPTSRLLYGTQVSDECRYKGIARVTFQSTDTTVCHAVFTKMLLDGVTTDVFVTTDSCRQTAWNNVNLVNFRLVFGTKSYDLNAQNFYFRQGSNGLGYFVPVVGLDGQRPCQQVACPYQPGMPLVSTLTNCKFVSYGPISTNLYSDGANEADVRLSPGGCVYQQTLNNVVNPLCFASVSGVKHYIGSDIGAPVYCTVPATQEVIFMGVAAFQDYGTQTDLLVIPFQG